MCVCVCVTIPVLVCVSMDIRYGMHKDVCIVVSKG